MAEHFLARDVYPAWKRRVRSAEASVWVLSPYLDHSVVRLLGNVKAVVETIVVTDIAPQAGPANYRKKLLALKKLLEAEVDVRSLTRLHAKVLVVDGVSVVAGSQNFTSYARRSKEVSVVSDVEPTAALAVLTDWVESAQPVDLELVERLLEATDENAKAVDLAVTELQSQVMDELASLETERAEQARLAAQREEAFARAAALRKRVAKTPWRLGMGTAYLVPDTATNYSDWHGQDDYPTMFGTNAWGERSGIDLTRWLRGDVAERQTLSLRHLYFYPMIHLPAGRMVFARIAQTRVTYVKHGVRFTSPKAVGGKSRYLALTLPEKLDDGANMILGVRPWSDSDAKHRIGIQFDGADFAVRWDSPATGPWAAQAAAAASVVLADLRHPSRGAQLLQRLFEPIKFTELGRENKTAAKFFGHKKHELTLIEFGNAHLFVARTA